jgi:hypothetical protein
MDLPYEKMRHFVSISNRKRHLVIVYIHYPNEPVTRHVIATTSVSVATAKQLIEKSTKEALEMIPFNKEALMISIAKVQSFYNVNMLDLLP